MATSSGQFQEAEDLRPEAQDRHPATVSLSEELEAVDWYDQRIDAAGDGALRAILRHNRDEEKEHAAMLIEWLRRRDPAWDAMLRRYQFTERPIAELPGLDEPLADDRDAGSPPSLPIGPHSGKEML